MKSVLVFGTFDPLHPGHRNMFEQARQHGDKLIVLVSRNATVEKLKGHTPEQNEQERLKAVAGLPEVDQAMLGDEEDYMAFLDRIVPDVICLGYDQTFLVEKLERLLKERGLSIPIRRLKPHKPDRYKSSLYRRRGKT